MRQLALSAILYNGMLSVYFLLTARFRWSNRRISRTVEPLMHIVAIRFPLLTASVGAFMDIFAEPALGLGCFINYGYGVTGEDVDGGRDLFRIGWVFVGIPRFVAGTLIIVNNIVIWRFVKQHARPFLLLQKNQNQSLRSRFAASRGSSSFSSLVTDGVAAAASEGGGSKSKSNCAKRKSSKSTAAVSVKSRFDGSVLSRFDDESMLVVTTTKSLRSMEGPQQHKNDEGMHRFGARQ
mmetsp:Transcript_25475/g.60268  ORF Transcript_25475/g.60268 Transcript_25475/m.60268 type:complete len:237 (-) Transcript_25475:309-1019(-)